MQGEVEDYVQATLSLHNGIPMSMEINFGSHAPMPIWVVGGEKATLQVVSETEAYVYENGKIAQQITRDMFPKMGAELIYTSFAGCLLRQEALEVTLKQAISTMEVVDSIRESAQTGKEMTYGNSVLGTAARI
jgi:predicted dehydrogenase